MKRHCAIYIDMTTLFHNCYSNFKHFGAPNAAGTSRPLVDQIRLNSEPCSTPIYNASCDPFNDWVDN